MLVSLFVLILLMVSCVWMLGVCCLMVRILLVLMYVVFGGVVWGGFFRCWLFLYC